MKLTVKSIGGLTLPAGKRDHIEFDDAVPGFGIRLREKGSQTWVFQYRIGSKQRRMALGKVSAIPVDKARDTARDLHARVRLGEDPAMDKVYAVKRAGETFGVLAERFMEARRPKWRPRSYTQVVRHLRKYAKRLHSKPIASVSRRDIADLLDLLAKESGDATANRTQTSLSAFFSWAIREGFELPQGNVASNTNRRPQTTRDRVLAPDEIRAVWNACRNDDYSEIVKLLLLTGCRANEIARLQHDEIVDDRIELPPQRTKNGRQHVVPLSALAKAILSARPADGDAPCVFGRDGTGFGGWGKAKTKLDARITEQTGKALPHWVPHDLRRTVATGMADLGVQPHIIEAVLNHVSGHKSGVAGVYNRSTYDREKREALNLWAEHLMAVVLLSGSGKSNTDRILRLYQAMKSTATVVPLKRA